MESIAIIAGLALVLAWALREIRKQSLVAKQVPSLKKAIVKNEELSKQRDEQELDTADGADVVDFLNRLRENDRSTD